jgi:hypothetical protein
MAMMAIFPAACRLDIQPSRRRRDVCRQCRENGKCRQLDPARWGRGRRRTRQDQISNRKEFR